MPFTRIYLSVVFVVALYWLNIEIALQVIVGRWSTALPFLHSAILRWKDENPFTFRFIKVVHLLFQALYLGKMQLWMISLLRNQWNFPTRLLLSDKTLMGFLLRLRKVLTYFPKCLLYFVQMCNWEVLWI